MKFYSRDKVYRQIQEIKAAGYRSVPVPPLVGDLVLVPVLAFGTLYGCYFGKSVFGLYARMAYNFLEFEIHKFVIALLIAILLHPLIRSSLYPGTIFSSHSSIGLFGVFPHLSTGRPVGRVRAILALLLPYLLVTLGCLALLKVQWDWRAKWVDYNYVLYVMYCNAAICCGDFYKIFRIAMAPGKSQILFIAGEVYYRPEQDRLMQCEAKQVGCNEGRRGMADSMCRTK